MKWRDVLTAEECATIAAADSAKAEWQRLSAVRAFIVNRAIKRAKYRTERSAATPQSTGQPSDMNP